MTDEREKRRAELAANLDAFEERLRDACAAVGRSREEITVIAVTKTFPAEDIRLLAELGITNIGENRDQEAAPKAAACADLPLTWHFVGQVQTNKCRSIARYAHVVHSIDRMRLVDAMSAAAVRAGREIACLVQVNLDHVGADRPAAEAREGPGHRAGARPSDVLEIADAVASAPGLMLAGVMGIAPLAGPARPAFTLLRDVAADVRGTHPSAVVISAGMSADFADAIACGATHVRVGAALLGSRPPVR